jgi:trehalose 6-phosphate synthase
MAYAMARALAMPLAERKERFESMMAFLTTHDVNRWCDDFLNRLSPG